MTTFRTYLAILRAHWLYLLIYLVLLSAMAVFVGASAGGSGEGFEPTASRVAVIDRDGSALSQALAAHALEGNQEVALADERRAVQDALARDTVSYLLVIPEGWGAGLLSAAAAGEDAPSLETYVSFRSGEARMLDVEVTSYANALYGLAATLGGDETGVVARADEAWEASVDVDVLPQEATPLPEGLRAAACISSYSIFSTATVCIATLMASVNRRPVRDRRLVSPAGRRGEGAALLGACVVVALVAWAVNYGLEVALFGREALVGSPAQVALVGAALLVYALVSAGIGYLLGCLGVSENAANGVANVLGMAFSLLSGAWTGLSLLSGPLLALAHATPAYWMALVINGAAGMGAVSAASVTPLLADLAVCAAFGVGAVVLGALASRRRR